MSLSLLDFRFALVLDVVYDVLFQHSAVFARSCHACNFDVVGFDEVAHRRRGEMLVAFNLIIAPRPFFSDFAALFFFICVFCRHFCFFLFLPSFPLSLHIDLEQRLTHLAYLSLLIEQFSNQPGVASREFSKLLVGGDVGELLVLLDTVSRLDVPFLDGAFLDF